jgi:hypothetical protein
MESKLKVEIVVTKDEIAKMLAEQAERIHVGYKVKSVYFQLTTEDDPEDWQCRNAPSHVFDKVVINMEKA